MTDPKHMVAVIGGATAGAEVAGRLAEGGVEVAVFEQNPRPYGKIEDGLPRWHVALRRKEYANIAAKLSQPGVHYVPNTGIGRDIDFADFLGWGWSAVVLANGAWRDRPLPVEGADDYVDKGLIYQNPFIIWFNHADEKDYTGPVFEPKDGAIVVGGGLASIDVAKVLMLETTRAALAERGIEVGMVELEVKGIPRWLEANGLTWDDLGLEGCTIYYRRRMEDMPLVEAPEGATPERLEKVAAARKKLLEKAMEKYKFRVEFCAAPDGLIVEDDRLVGLRFRRTRIEDGRVIPTDETFEARGTCVISSIGSVPAPILGIPMRGELYAFSDWNLGRMDDFPMLFAAGNIVTGKGNIVASRKHARAVTEEVIAHYLGVGDGEPPTDEAGSSPEAEAVAAAVKRFPPLDPDVIDGLRVRVKERQQAVGYDGDYDGWIARVTPPDLE